MRHYRANVPSYKERAKAWAATNPIKRRRILLRYNYGNIDVRPCPVLCELCGIRKARCFDHDHKTGKFRGWLCYRCNTALAAFGDTVEGLYIAIYYLTRASCS